MAERDQPPSIEFVKLGASQAPPLPGVPVIVNVAQPTIQVAIKARGASRITSRRFTLGGRTIDLPPLAGPTDSLVETVALTLPPNELVSLVVHADNQNATSRSRSIELRYQAPAPPPPPAAKPRLVVVGFGADTFPRPDLPPIRFASDDAEAVAFPQPAPSHAGRRTRPGQARGRSSPQRRRGDDEQSPGRARPAQLGLWSKRAEGRGRDRGLPRHVRAGVRARDEARRRGHEAGRAPRLATTADLSARLQSLVNAGAARCAVPRRPA